MRGMLYRRKKKNPKTGILEPKGPWWMKYYINGRPFYRSTGHKEKTEAESELNIAMGDVAKEKQESPKVHQTRFEHLEKDL